MNSNSNAIFTLCSHLCIGDNVAPLEPKEWGDLAKKLMEAGLHPESIFELSKAEFKEKLFVSEEYVDRIFRLLDRNASLSFELSQLEIWQSKLLPSRQFGYVVLTTSHGILDHEDARKKNAGGKILGMFF